MEIDSFINQLNEIRDDLREPQHKYIDFLKTLFKQSINDFVFTSILSGSDIFKPHATTVLDILNPFDNIKILMANFKDYGENMFSTTNMIFGYLKILNLNITSHPVSPRRFYKRFLSTSSTILFNIPWITWTRGERD